MPTRNMVLSEHQSELVECGDAQEIMKLNALRAAAQHGWDDIANGRFADVTDEDLESFVHQLGTRPAGR